MTYQEYQRLIMDATEFDDEELYIADAGGSMPESVPDELLVPMLREMYDYAHSRTLGTLLKQTGMNRAEFGREYRVPYRTLQHWDDGDRGARAYVLDLVAYAVIMRDRD